MTISEMINEYSVTKAEKRIVESMRLGYIQSKDIADYLCIDTRTVDTHLQNIYRKLGVKSKGELLFKLLERQNEQIEIPCRF